MKQMIYRGLLKFIPPKITCIKGKGLSQSSEENLLKLLRRHRCRGGVLRLFNRSGLYASYYFGGAGKSRHMTENMIFRIASISKMVTALSVLKLSELGVIRLDEDIGILPYQVSLEQLMSHTAAIRDGHAYIEALSEGADLSAILKGDSFFKHPPGQKWAYSNFGAGLIASVLEIKLNKSFETIMQETLFKPLSVKATFYPQFSDGDLSDARRVLPPTKHAGFDAKTRKNKPVDDAHLPLPERHYLLSQGNCCINGENLQILLSAVMKPGFLSQSSLDKMRFPQADFGEISSKLKQGLGLFMLSDSAICSDSLYGHQGNAYGAVHAVFFEPVSQRGMIFLSSGVSQAKREFLSDVVTDLLQFCFEEEQWHSKLQK